MDKKRAICTPYKENHRFLMILQVAEAPKVDFLGPGTNFFDVRKRSLFLHRFGTEKVPQMTPKWSQNGPQKRQLSTILVLLGSPGEPQDPKVSPMTPK